MIPSSVSITSILPNVGGSFIPSKDSGVPSLLTSLLSTLTEPREISLSLSIDTTITSSTGATTGASSVS